MTIYDAARCPYCARVRIALAEKGVEHELFAIDLSDRPAWLYEKNPLGKVPVLEEDAFVLPESEVIMEYLEDRYPEPALLPADPAAARAVAAPGAPLRRPARRRLLRLPPRRCERARASARLTRSTLRPPPLRLDIAYLPWVIRVPALLGLELPPHVDEWLARIAERPSVAAELDIVAALPR